MHSLDRWWWLRLIPAFAYVLAIPLFVSWYVAFVLPYDFSYHGIALPDAIFAIIAVFALLTLAWHACLAAWLERQRYDRREAAQVGNQDALPLTRSATEEASAETPPIIEAIQPQPIRQVAGILITCAFWLGGFIFCADLVLRVVLSPFGINVPVPSSPPARPTAHPIQYPVLAAVVWFGGMAIALLRLLFAEQSALPYMAARVEVSEEGIACYSLFGRRGFLSWQDARLLEVSVLRKRLQQGGPLIEFRRYSLYGSDTVLRWEERHPPAGARIMPLFEQIAPAVRLHTGLLPRTLDARALAPDATLDLAGLDRLVKRLPMWLAFTTFSMSFLTFILVDRVFIVIDIIYGCLAGFTWLISKAGKRRRTKALSIDIHIQVANPTYGSLLSRGAVYEMTVGSYHAFVINQVIFVILGLCAVGFSLVILGGEFAQYVLRVSGLHFYPLPPALLLVVVGIMILGVVTIVVAVRARDTIVLAGANGLRKRWLMGNTFLSWGDVDRIEHHLIYIVYGRNGHTRITWPQRPFKPSHRAQEQGAILLTPDEMAALVAEQISQPIQVSGRG